MTAFRKSLEPVAAVAPGILRLVAPNPSMMTGPGTNTYLLGRQQVAVIDPGPAIDRHIDAILGHASGPVRWILATHTHPDHSPGVARLAARTGAEVLGMPAPAGAHQDASFVPDRPLADGARLDAGEFALEAIHTPGHASNHLCYRHVGLGWIFTGDHIIEGSTVVIDPPDGNMRDYLASLARIRDLRPAALLPGHGDVIDEPARVIDWIIDHRLAREHAVRKALRTGAGGTARELVAAVYPDVPAQLHGWAERSLLAHLIKLVEDGEAIADNVAAGGGEAGIEDRRWRLAATRTPARGPA
ncbi:MAG TPA: MBL fold metallo-hydrolase [Woeseiaceae bacterium]|nr:MBL fold metallo-hydrolase [Woeseiaceae bacterium]